MNSTDDQLKIASHRDLEFMKEMQCYIAIRGSHNITEMSDVPDEKMKLFQAYNKPVLDHRVNHTKWVVLRWPNASMAQLAGMSTQAVRGFLL